MMPKERVESALHSPLLYDGKGTLSSRSSSAAAEVPRRPDPDANQTTVQLPVDIRSAALTILAVFASILLLQYAQAVVIPVVLAALISYALDPVVIAMVRLHVSRALAAAILLVGLVAGGSLMVYSLRSEATEILYQLPEAARRVRQTIERAQPGSSAIKQVQQAANELEKAADAASSSAPRSVPRVEVQTPFNASDYFLSGSMGIAAALGQTVLVLFLAYFLLASGDLYKRKLVKIAGPSLTKKKITLQILEEIDRQIEMFLVVQVATSALVAAATWLALRTIGLQQAAVWGILAGVFNSIPYFGPVLVTGAMAIVAFLQFGTIHMTVLVAGVALAITSLEGMLLTPWLTSRAARMNAVAIFVGLLFWGWVWNIWGLLLAVPMLMIVKAVCDHVEDFKSVGELLGD